MFNVLIKYNFIGRWQGLIILSEVKPLRLCNEMQDSLVC